MTDPLRLLADQLFQAAQRIERDDAADALTGPEARDPAGHHRKRRERAGASRARLLGHSRSLRSVIIALAALLGMTAVTLAATGVILTGTPVRPEEVLNPRLGEGLPAHGGSRLLPLRVSDPAGGLPWGMRVVHTTRGELCLQVGRLQNGELGELGVDGAFENDGRFHPITAAALPSDALDGQIFGVPYLASATATCLPSGEAFIVRHPGVDRSAAAKPPARNAPPADLRDIYYGVLGGQALSVTYRLHGRVVTVPVQHSLGAYLIVVDARGGIGGYGGANVGIPGELAPTAPLTAITYELHGRLCERAVGLRPGVEGHVVHPCPLPSSSPQARAAQGPYVPIHAQVETSHGVVTGVEVNFTAPYAVTSARQAYLVGVRERACAENGQGAREAVQASGAVGERLAQDVHRGSQVKVRLPDPFGSPCNPQRQLQLQVSYSDGSAPPVSVGNVEISEPPGTRPR